MHCIWYWQYRTGDVGQLGKQACWYRYSPGQHDRQVELVVMQVRQPDVQAPQVVPLTRQLPSGHWVGQQVVPKRQQPATQVVQAQGCRAAQVAQGDAQRLHLPLMAKKGSVQVRLQVFKAVSRKQPYTQEEQLVTDPMQDRQGGVQAEQLRGEAMRMVFVGQIEWQDWVAVQMQYPDVQDMHDVGDVHSRQGDMQGWQMQFQLGYCWAGQPVVQVELAPLTTRYLLTSVISQVVQQVLKPVQVVQGSWHASHIVLPPAIFTQQPLGQTATQMPAYSRQPLAQRVHLLTAVQVLQFVGQGVQMLLWLQQPAGQVKVQVVVRLVYMVNMYVGWQRVQVSPVGPVQYRQGDVHGVHFWVMLLEQYYGGHFVTHLLVAQYRYVPEGAEQAVQLSDTLAQVAQEAAQPQHCRSPTARDRYWLLPHALTQVLPTVSRYFSTMVAIAVQQDRQQEWLAGWHDRQGRVQDRSKRGSVLAKLLAIVSEEAVSSRVRDHFVVLGALPGLIILDMVTVRLTREDTPARVTSASLPPLTTLPTATPAWLQVIAQLPSTVNQVGGAILKVRLEVELSQLDMPVTVRKMFDFQLRQQLDWLRVYDTMLGWKLVSPGTADSIDRQPPRYSRNMGAELMVITAGLVMDFTVKDCRVGAVVVTVQVSACVSPETMQGWAVPSARQPISAGSPTVTHMPPVTYPLPLPQTLLISTGSWNWKVQLEALIVQLSDMEQLSEVKVLAGVVRVTRIPYCSCQIIYPSEVISWIDRDEVCFRLRGLVIWLIARVVWLSRLDPIVPAFPIDSVTLCAPWTDTSTTQFAAASWVPLTKQPAAAPTLISGGKTKMAMAPGARALVLVITKLYCVMAQVVKTAGVTFTLFILVAVSVQVVVIFYMGLELVSRVQRDRDSGERVIGVRMESMPMVNRVLPMRALLLKLEISSRVAVLRVQVRGSTRVRLLLMQQLYVGLARVYLESNSISKQLQSLGKDKAVVLVKLRQCVDDEPTALVDRVTLNPEVDVRSGQELAQQECEATNAPFLIIDSLIWPTAAVVLGSWISNSLIVQRAMESLKKGCKVIIVTVVELVESILSVASRPTVSLLRKTKEAQSLAQPYYLGIQNWTISVVLTFSVMVNEAAAVTVAPIAPASEMAKSGIVLAVVPVIGTVQQAICFPDVQNWKLIWLLVYSEPGLRMLVRVREKAELVLADRTLLALRLLLTCTQLIRGLTVLEQALPGQLQVPLAVEVAHMDGKFMMMYKLAGRVNGAGFIVNWQSAVAETRVEERLDEQVMGRAVVDT